MTINVSQLWRNPEQWSLLAERVIPELAADGGRLRCWSAGIVVRRRGLHAGRDLPRRGAPGARRAILGTDIDRRMVARAREGFFTEDDARTAPREQLDPLVRARPRRLPGQATSSSASLRFEVGDLLRLRPKRAAYDLVLCRNTVIYFNEEVRDALHARLAESLRPGGFLLVGSTERVSNADAIGLEARPPLHLQEDLTWTTPSTCRCSSRRRASTSRS